MSLKFAFRSLPWTLRPCLRLPSLIGAARQHKQRTLFVSTLNRAQQALS